MSHQRVKSSEEENFAVGKRCRREAARHDLDTQDDASKDSLSSLLFSTIVSISSRGSAFASPVASQYQPHRQVNLAGIHDHALL